MALKCYTSVAKRLKLKVRKSFGLIHTFVFNKITDMKACIFIKKRPHHRYFCVNIKIFKNNFSYGTSPVAASENGRRIYRHSVIEEMK